METTGQRTETQNLENKTNEIVQWLGLVDVPTASQLDPDGKMGLQDAFRKYGGVYVDPIPESLVETKKRHAFKQKGSAEISLLAHKTMVRSKSRIIAGSHPFFKEWVFAVAQYLAKLGFEVPTIKGETFVMTDKEQSKVKTYSTKDPQIKVRVARREPDERSPVSSISLLVIAK